MRRHLTYANVMATLAVVLVVGGGAAYAADTVFSSDIVDGEVKSVDIGNNQIRSGDVRDDNFPGGGLTRFDLRTDSVGALEVMPNAIDTDEIADDSLTGADIKESTLDAVQGRGTILANREVVPNGTHDTLLQIPGLGRLEVDCSKENVTGIIWWRNTTSVPLDLDWDRALSSTGSQIIAPPDYVLYEGPTADLALGWGNGPDAYRIATVHATVWQVPFATGPCGAQAQVIVSTSG